MVEGIETQNTKVNVDRVKKKADNVRKTILETLQIDEKNIAPTLFHHDMKRNDAGLNEISNVDMGYACTTIDENVSKRNPYIHELEYNVGLMKESDNSVLILNGDLFTFIPKTQNGKMLSYEDQVAYFYALLKDVAEQDKVLAMVRGTQEHRIYKNHDEDVMGALQEALGLKNKVCNDALIKLNIKDDMVGDAEVGIRTINWNNSATTGAYIGRKMDERATKRGGADIYLARTTMNYFRTSLVGESVNGKKEERPIYLISSGSYTPFKGAMTAGAEYNSIKDGELAPSNFWYRINVEENKEKEEGQRPYIVRVNPVSYTAHQINYQGTDKVTAAVENEIRNASDSFVQMFIERYSEALTNDREEGRESVRDVLLRNRQTDEKNKQIKQYLFDKKNGLLDNPAPSVKEKREEGVVEKIIDKNIEEDTSTNQDNSMEM